MTITYPNQPSNADKAISLSLDAGAIVDLQPPTNGVWIEVQSGSLWVTQEGDPADHIVNPDHSFKASGQGLIVLQALSCSKFRMPTG